VQLLQNASMLYGMLLPILCLGQVSAMTPQEVVCGGNYCGACCLYALLTAPQIAIDILTLPVTSILLPLGTCVHFPMRSTIRKKYNIPGNDCEDCLTVWLCACCALAQVQHKKL
jgi:Cys-rich protein (TIGR01571 family)